MTRSALSASTSAADELGGAKLAEELIDLSTDLAGRGGKIVGERLDRYGAGARVLRRLADTHDLVRGVVGAACRHFHAAGYFLGRSALFGDGTGNRTGNLTDLADRPFDAGNGLDRTPCRALHRRDLRADLLGRLRGL